MLQKRFLGTPTEAGVSSSVYYVTKADIATAKQQYEDQGGCWPSTISAFKRELLIVGDNSKIKRLVKSKGPPPLYGNPEYSNRSLVLRFSVTRKCGYYICEALA